MLAFFGAIVIGSVLLALPASSASGRPVPYLDALFTATTSVCVTGLVTMPTVSAWSTFGHAVILLLIQIGGLGVITVFSGFIISAGKKLGIGYRMLVQDSFNLNSLDGMMEFTNKVILSSFAVEGAGALLYMTVFVPEYGARGIWISVFTSVSAFCNAGLDIISENSLCDYALNPVVNFTTMFLIIMGGIGFVVWLDIVRAAGRVKTMGAKTLSRLTLHSKIALSTTFILIVSGTLAVLVFEYNNPQTIGNMTFLQKIQASLFQSVTTRTAGFATVPQENLTAPTALISMLLMFIGGSPVGTAGGIKTVTVTVILACALAAVKQKDEVTLFGRNLSKQAVKKAIGVAAMSFMIAFISGVLLSAVSQGDVLDTLYESVSACATVGLSRNFTGTLTPAGKAIIIATMYLGRVGPISLAVAFNRKIKPAVVKSPVEEVSIG
ncbi:MAG: potassium transporter KtrB [Clostridia bacterium]|nr:potassium transporter KtrB [Clostridia bacterium]